MKPLSEQQKLFNDHGKFPMIGRKAEITDDCLYFLEAARNDYSELIEWAGKAREPLAGFLEMLTKEAPVNPETLIAISKLQQLLGELQP